MRVTRFRCHYCGSQCSILYTEQVVKGHERKVAQCTNADCGAVLKFMVSLESVVTPPIHQIPPLPLTLERL